MSENGPVSVEVRAEELPRDLGRGVEKTEAVRLDVVDRDGEARFMRFRGIGAYRNTSVEEAVARVRALRDEWD